MFGKKKKKEGDDKGGSSDKKKAKAEKKAAKAAKKQAKKEAKAAKKAAKKEAKAAKKEAKKKGNKEADTTGEEAESPVPATKKKKFFTLKKLIVILLLLLALGIASGVVYLLYFNKSSETNQYKPITLAHVSLPDEVLEFSFNFFPDLYVSLLMYNKETILLADEINRIEAVAAQYPDQKRIADKEKKTWESAKKRLAKSFEKIQKKIESLFVAYKVNPDAGIIRVNEEKEDLALTAREALGPSMDLTQRVKTKEKIPEGLVGSSVYKAKKKWEEFRK